MIKTDDCLDLIPKLDPATMIRHLTNAGWKEYPVTGNDIRAFQYVKDGIFEQVTVPLDKSLKDYNEAMYDAVCKTAFLEGKSVEALMTELLNPKSQTEWYNEFTGTASDMFAILQPIEKIEAIKALHGLGASETGQYRIVYCRHLPYEIARMRQDAQPYALFQKIHFECPPGYSGRALRIGDILAIRIQDNVKCYYLQRFDFHRLPDFWKHFCGSIHGNPHIKIEQKEKSATY